jgi:hypothetical protein
MTADARSAALLAHIVAQTRQNIDFLLEHNHISKADASTILAKLAKPSTTQNDSLSANVTSPPSNHTPHRTAPPPPPPVASSPSPLSPSPPLVQCRAIWAYQAQVSALSSLPEIVFHAHFIPQDEKDLSFQANETITIVEENNSDWWTGSLSGRTGLFPSSYVQKIPSMPQAGVAPSAYRPFGGAPFYPPPPGPYFAPVNPVGLPEQEKKSGRFGEYGSTVGPLG